MVLDGVILLYEGTGTSVDSFQSPGEKKIQDPTTYRRQNAGLCSCFLTYGDSLDSCDLGFQPESNRSVSLCSTTDVFYVEEPPASILFFRR